MEKELKITEEAILAAYKKASNEQQILLSSLFPSVDFTSLIPIIDRIKTFDDACKELSRRAERGDDDAARLLCDYESNSSNISIPETVAYMKLCIVVYALNEGWKPRFTEEERRWYPLCYLYTQNEINEMDDWQRSELALWGAGASGGPRAGLGCASSVGAWSDSGSGVGSRLALKNERLATYAGKQFVSLYADFCVVHSVRYPEAHRDLSNC